MQPSIFVRLSTSISKLKEKLIPTLIIATLVWSQPFKFICNANDYADGAVLVQHINKVFHPI